MVTWVWVSRRVLPRLQGNRGRRMLLSLCWAACSAAFASPPEPDAVGPFDFAYRIGGNAVARPLQVFDDGVGKTYFQFARDQPVPLILVGAGPDAVTPVPEGPYQVVPGRARQYRLVFRGRVARVDHVSLLHEVPGTGPSGLPVVPRAAGPAPGRDGGPPTFHPADRTQSSYATPTRGDVIAWTEPDRQVLQALEFAGGQAALPRDAQRRIAALRRQLGPEVSVRILVARPDALTHRRMAILHRALREEGIPSERIAIASDAASGADSAEGDAGTEAAGPETVRLVWRAPGLSGGGVGAGEVARRAGNAAERAGGGHHRSAPPSGDGIEPAASGSPGAAPPATAPVPAVTPPRHPPASAERPASPAPTAMPGVFGRPLASNFDILASDVTVAATLRRWAARSGYRLEWTSPVDAPITGEMTLDVDGFPDAVDRVMAGLRASGYPLTAHVPSDKVVRISSMQ